MAREKNASLVYVRRSTGKQELSLPGQLDWSLTSAAKEGVRLDATQLDLTHALNHRLNSFKAIRLDNGISGSDLNRPGFLALINDAINDPTVSHVFFHKRDRFARPDDAMEAAQLEKRLLYAGITVFHSDGVSMPLRRGEQNTLRDFELLLAYSQSGEELRKHAERIVMTQRQLAEAGFRTGGRAPYGFVRVLVDKNGEVVQELSDGRTVREEGFHVRVVPKYPEKIAVWLQILDWNALGSGHKRMSGFLNKSVIPSPDAGRTRTDHGVKHLVSGKWTPKTVAYLCKNAIILGVQEFGKQSRGKIRRLGEKGPRLLTDADYGEKSGNPRRITNDDSLRIIKTVGPSQYDQKKWESIQIQTRARSHNQQGIPRAKDPARYPLSCRLIDLTDGCGATLHGRTAHDRTVYTCGRYLRSSGSECGCNQVDAEAILRFTLATLNQCVATPRLREKLHNKLLDRSRRARTGHANEQKMSVASLLQSRKSELQQQKTTIEYRMARERDDALYAILISQHETNRKELAEVAASLQKLTVDESMNETIPIETQVDEAMAFLDEVTRIATDPEARAKINPMLVRLGMRIGFTFGTSIQAKKRKVKKFQSGRLVFNNDPLPVRLFGKDNVDDRPNGLGIIPHADHGTAEIHQTNGRDDLYLTTKEGALPTLNRERDDNSSQFPVPDRSEGRSFTKDTHGET